MQKRSELYEPERSGARRSQYAKDSRKQSGNRRTGAHEVNPDLDLPKFGVMK